MTDKQKWPQSVADLPENLREILDDELVAFGGNPDKAARSAGIKPILLKTYLQTDKPLKEAQRDGAIRSCGGIVLAAAGKIGIARETLSRAISKSVRLKTAQILGSENQLDVAESKVLNGINKNDGAMVRYYLDRKGKSRGWSTRHEIATESGAITNVGQVLCYLPDNGRDDRAEDGD